jgi:hypothetical protein
VIDFFIWVHPSSRGKIDVAGTNPGCIAAWANRSPQGVQRQFHRLRQNRGKAKSDNQQQAEIMAIYLH